MGRSGHNQDKPAFTLFSFASGLFVQPINFHYKDQMQRSLVLDCFSQKKRSQPNICEEEMEDREKQLLEAVHTIAKTRKNFPRHFPSCSLMRLLSIDNFCSVCPEFPSLA